MSDQLKLIAMDLEDLQIISSHCQDGVVKVSDLHYFTKENRFALEMNRFAWEKSAVKKTVPERRRSVLHFEQVQKVSSIGFNLSAKETVLSLLAINFEEDEAPAGTIELIFSNDISIRLKVECVEVQLADMKAAWAASSKPNHS